MEGVTLRLRRTSMILSRTSSMQRPTDVKGAEIYKDGLAMRVA